MDFPLTSTATLLAVFESTIFQVRVGRARLSNKIFPPDFGENNPDFKAVLRTQENHTENLVTFIPSLWLAALATKNDTIVGATGVAWVLARAAYAWGYAQKESTKRAPGFKASLLLQNGLLFTGLAYAGKALYDKYCK